MNNTIPQSAETNTTRNLFPDPNRSIPPTQPTRPELPLSDTDLPDSDSDDALIQPLDAIKFFLATFKVDTLDPQLHKRFKERVFTVQNLVEDLLIVEAYFKHSVAQLYDHMRNESGIELCASLLDFRQSVLRSQTASNVLADSMLFYIIYRASSEKSGSEIASIIALAQEFTEILNRTPNSSLTFICFSINANMALPEILICLQVCLYLIHPDLFD